MDSTTEKPLDSTAQAAINGAVDQIKSKHGGARQGAGRRPKSMGNQVERNQTQNVESDVPVVSEEDVKFCRQIAESGLKIIDGIVTRRVYGAVELIDEPMARKFATEVHITDEDSETVGLAVASLARKYAFLTQYAPEFALIAWSVSYTARVVTVTNEVRKIRQAAEFLASKKHKEQASASPPQAD